MKDDPDFPWWERPGVIRLDILETLTSGKCLRGIVMDPNDVIEPDEWDGAQRWPMHARLT